MTAIDAPASASSRAQAAHDATVREICRVVAGSDGDLAQLVDRELRRLVPLLSPDDQRAIGRRALAHLSGIGELDVHLRDDAIDEVLVNAGGDIWVDRAGSLERVGSLEYDHIDHLIERIIAPLGRRVDRSSPIVDARLPDGSRVCVVLAPVAVDGAAVSIRRFARNPLRLESFADGAVLELVRHIVAERCNVMVSGATSSGKTSLVAAMLSCTPPNERLLVIEDTCELPLDHLHTVRLEARPATVDGPVAIDLAQLVRTALRLRPDRIVVGEVRGDEVLALVQAMNTGHDGSISTCHANGPADAMLRLESLVLQAAPSWPIAAVRHHLARSVDVVIHVERLAAGATRRVVAIAEVVGPGQDGHHADAPLALRPLTAHTGSGLDVTSELIRGRR